MQEKIDRFNRETINKINREFKLQTIARLHNERKFIIEKLKASIDEISEQNAFGKMMAIGSDVVNLSVYTDNEVLDVLNEFGVTKCVTNFFVHHEDIFESLDAFQSTSKYLFLYSNIWHFYMAYSYGFIHSRLALNLGIELTKAMNKVRRQENAGRLPEFLKEAHIKLKEMDNGIKEEIPEFRLSMKEDKLVSTIRKNINFPHRIHFYNLYKLMFSFNQESHADGLIEINKFSEYSFKAKFYDLLYIMFRDKKKLEYSDDVEARYGEPRNIRIKVKIIEQLILSGEF